MKIRKIIDTTALYFEIKGDSLTLDQEQTLVEIITSLLGFKFINKNKPFNELIKEQQKHQKYILMDVDTKPFDELRYICKVVFNFLVETDQIKKFMIDQIEFKFGDDEVIVYSTEQFFIYDEHGYKIDFIDKITFSPTIRSQWSDPILTEKILLKS